MGRGRSKNIRWEMRRVIKWVFPGQIGRGGVMSPGYRENEPNVARKINQGGDARRNQRYWEGTPYRKSVSVGYALVRHPHAESR